MRKGFYIILFCFLKKIATIDFQFSAKLLHGLVLICFTWPICYFSWNEQTGIWSQLDIICPMTYEQVNCRRWKSKNLFVLPYISTFLVKKVFSASPLPPPWFQKKGKSRVQSISKESNAMQRRIQQSRFDLCLQLWFLMDSKTIWKCFYF